MLLQKAFCGFQRGKEEAQGLIQNTIYCFMQAMLKVNEYLYNYYNVLWSPDFMHACVPLYSTFDYI